MKIKSIAALLLLATASFALFLTSCQQDPDVDFNPPPTNDSTYISMVIAVDSTAPSGLDTLFKNVYTYDAQKRISMIQQFEYDNGIRELYWTQQLRHYHGNDTLPYMLVSFFQDFPGTDDTDSTYLFYNSNNIIVKDSQVYINNFNGAKSIFVANYTQLSNTRYKIRFEQRIDEPAGIYVDSIMVTQIVQNGNVISKRDSVWSEAYPGAAVYTTQLTYDNKPNPMFRILLPYMWNSEGYSSFGNDIELTQSYTSVNNVTSVLTTWEHPYEGNYSYSANNISYDYRADGYPKVKRHSEYADNAKTFYIYKRL